MLEPRDGATPKRFIVKETVILSLFRDLFGIEKGLELVVVKNNDTRNAMTIR